MVSQRAAEKEAYGAVKEFAKDMEKKYGLRMFVLTAHVDPKESIIYAQ
jgi:hypothetical protein